LIVEDEPTVLRAIARALRHHGFVVETAACCVEARATTGHFDIGIFDIGLPDGNGVQLAEGMISDLRVGRAMFFTADSRVSVQERAARVGPVVRKGDGVEALMQVLQGLLGRRAVIESGVVAHDEDSGDEHRRAGKKSAG
jgi:two-component system nitrogen regulation response regulator GlnG